MGAYEKQQFGKLSANYKGKSGQQPDNSWTTRGCGLKKIKDLEVSRFPLVALECKEITQKIANDDTAVPPRVRMKHNRLQHQCAPLLNKWIEHGSRNSPLPILSTLLVIRNGSKTQMHSRAEVHPVSIY